eukprot:gnl/TRDRNA2_/TRDRNA2_157853_c0_seq2.p1 gnl/TRDRNA2_/TRDRNA2_157853_c0~~gnl/TRDRNA2_/TRDRNA2_157853_c0_seq2.p1  ORF type:complete len:346 (-),score=46.54 gnl/TRDRNA2_/TRDRNA2_157853_c0_seq2:140-1108(-)
MDSKEKRLVAVKFYDPPTEEPAMPEMLRKFRHEVDVLQRLHATDIHAEVRAWDRKEICQRGSLLLPEGAETMSEVGTALRDMPHVGGDLFVSLLDFSRDVATGRPGPSAEGFCFLVEEMGLQTLAAYIQDQREFDELLSSKEVRQIYLALAQIVAGLHCCGLVHLDIKPSNLMRFPRGGGRKGKCWKLVDMDAVLEAGTTVDPCDVTATPVYCPPELATAVSNGSHEMRVSRKMDVWSAGMSILDCILPESLLQARFKQEPATFLEWLGAENTAPADIGTLKLPTEVHDFDPELAAFLSDRVFRWDPTERCSILEVVQLLES